MDTSQTKLIEAQRLLGVSGVVTPGAVLVAYSGADAAIAERLALGLPDAIGVRLEAQRAALREARDLLLQVPSDQPAPMVGNGASASRTPSEKSLAERPGHHDELLGTTLSKRYEIIDLIGQGGMGAVYQALDKLKQTYVAIKVIAPELISQRGVQERFISEAKLACSLSHPNIIRVHDVNVDDGRYFITMELLHGQTLRAKMDEQKRARVPFPTNQALAIAKDLLSALAFAHQHLVHRDIKPENIWVCDDGTVKIMDFGLALSLQGAQKSRPTQSMASAYYVAPEQLRGATLDKRSDQYSLAVVIYELLSGRVPTGTVKALHVLRRDVPAGVSKAIQQALSDSPEERFASTEEFLEHLTRGELGLNRVDWARWKVPLLAGALALFAAGAVVVVPKMNFSKLHRIATDEDRDAAIKAEVSATQLMARLDAATKDYADKLHVLQANNTRQRDSGAGGTNVANKGTGDNQLEALGREIDAAQAELDFVSAELYSPEVRTDLMAKKAVADTYIKDAKFAEANDQYAELLASLSARAGALASVSELVAARTKAAARRTNWLALSNSQTGLSTLVSQAQQEFEDADHDIRTVQFVAALKAYRTASNDYQLLLDGVQQGRTDEELAKAKAAEVLRTEESQRALAKKQSEQARLAEYYRVGRQFQDNLRSGGMGPVMVVREPPGPAVNLRDDGNGTGSQGSVPLAISEHAVTGAEFSQFVAATGYMPRIVKVSQLYRDGVASAESGVVTAEDATAYAEWLSDQTGEKYRVATQVRASDMSIRFWLKRVL